jgi:hypothetical protein
MNQAAISVKHLVFDYLFVASVSFPALAFETATEGFNPIQSNVMQEAKQILSLGLSCSHLQKIVIYLYALAPLP